MNPAGRSTVAVVEITWVTVFVDRPATGFAETQEFWRRVTGSSVSSARGVHDQFASFVPPDGDVVLKIQRTTDGSSSSHLDLHVDDSAALAAHAESLGAERLDEFGEVVVLRSPGGFVWCAVPVRGEGVRPAPVGEPDRRVIVDQVCLDIAPERFDDECRFWSELTAWPLVPGVESGFGRLDTPIEQPLRFLLQQCGDDAAGSPTHSHLDLACDDVEVAVDDHLAFGAALVERFPWWTVMADPVGVEYCLTARSPDTGRPHARTSFS